MSETPPCTECAKYDRDGKCSEIGIVVDPSSAYPCGLFVASPPPAAPGPETGEAQWTGRDHRGAYRVDDDGTITRETWGGYRAVSDRDSYSNLETLVAPNGEEVCSLGEPEDRTLSRDMSPLVARLAAAEAERDEARASKDGAYRERDQVVALAARMAAVLRWPAWLGRHEDKPGDPPWDDDWRNIVFIELPSGQVSWHIHDSELPLVRFLPSALSLAAKPWDGHDTAEKYRRCDGPWEIRDLHSDLSAARADIAAAEAEVRRLREGLRAVEAHHAGMNKASGRPATNSHTLRIVRAALAGCSHLPGDVCRVCHPSVPICARHPDEPLRRFGPFFRCSECGEPGTLLQSAGLVGDDGRGDR